MLYGFGPLCINCPRFFVFRPTAALSELKSAAGLRDVRGSPGKQRDTAGSINFLCIFSHC